MLPGDPDDANKSTDAEEGKNGVAAQAVVPIATSPVASTSRSQPPKRPAVTSPNQDKTTEKPVVKRSKNMMATSSMLHSKYYLRVRPRNGGPRAMKRANTLLSFDEFSQLPFDVWLMVMRLFTPIELLELAHAHTFFKDLITRSPKKWGFVVNPWAHYGARTDYIIVPSYRARRPQLVYQISFAPVLRFRSSLVSALKILLNNAYFDQFGYGAGWGLPTPEQYKIAPHVRAHTAMLPIKGPKEDLCRQIALLEPYRVAVYADPNGELGEFRTVLRDVIGMNRPSLWVHFGHQIDEMAILLEAKSPSIRAYMSSAMLTKGRNEWDRKRLRDPGLVAQFRRTLIPAIHTIIEQWERREREIDAIVLKDLDGPYYMIDNALSREFTAEFAALPERICQGRTDPHQIVADQRDQCFVIRRGPGSHEGLVVMSSYGYMAFVLATCNYAFRKNRTRDHANDYLDAMYRVDSKLFGLPKELDGPFMPLDRKREYETARREWANTEPYHSIPTRELAIDRLLWTVRLFGRGNLPEEFDKKRDPILKAYGGAPK